MTQSTDAILCFGIQVGNEDEPPAFLGVDEDGDHRDFDDWLLDEHGLGYENDEATYEQRRAVEEACPVDMVMHCSDDCPMYILIVRGTEERASRGNPNELVTLPDDPSLAQVEAFKSWIKEHGITVEDPVTYEQVPITDPQPCWILCSMWN